MCTTLYIRHLSNKLAKEEREDFLKHFGARKVWFIKENSHTAFAQFPSVDAAEQALYRLHQLEILGKRLTVEYAQDRDKNRPQSNINDSADSNKLKQFGDSVNSWNPALNYTQPPSPDLFYKYPQPTPVILYNILNTLLKNHTFYTQTLHLMNKMCLDPPFGDLNEDIKSYIKDSLQYLNIKIQDTHNSESQIVTVNEALSSEESEISSDENIPTLDNNTFVQLPVKRKSKITRINKIPKLTLQAQLHNAEKISKKSKLKTEDVFESTKPSRDIKRIELIVNSTQLPTSSPDTQEIVGEIGKMISTKTDDAVQVTDSQDRPTAEFVSPKELLDNKISLQDMKVLPIFKNYHPGIPSTKIYIKNLAKDVEMQDLEKIYVRYITDCVKGDKNLFDLKLMQEGRMKGQAFINFPNVKLCEKALNETNGYILKGKPMVVQFARTQK